MKKWKLRSAASTLALAAALLTAGCGGGLAQRSAGLLALDYQTMSNAELQDYYRQLSDQLAREARASRAEKGIGFDTDRYGQAEDGSAAALRQRWNMVRGELRERKLLN
ncbi:MAG: hypothetical protein P8Y63_12770 [Deltaproteobacteria bacterium]|jgi:hypothetical protein